MMSESAATLSVLKTFPGARLIPQVVTNPSGMRVCEECGLGAATMRKDGTVMHQRCVK